MRLRPHGRRLPRRRCCLRWLRQDRHHEARGCMSPHDRRATERWLNEGGRPAPDDVLEREMAAVDVRRAVTTRAKSPPQSRSARLRVVIAGGGVAGLETLLALHALAGDRVNIT